MAAPQNENYCRNCGEPLSPAAEFCSACGQKNTDGRLTFPELVRSFIDSVFNLDARIFRTLRDLAIPGKLTQQFFQGKHMRYYHPVRLFVVSGALMIAAITLVLPKEEMSLADDDWQRRQMALEQRPLFEKLDSLTEQAKSTATDSLTLQALDSLSAQLDSLPLRVNLDSFPVGQILNLGPETQTGGTMMAMEDVLTLSPDSLCQKYGVTGIVDRLLVGQTLRVLHSPTDFAFYLIGNIIWMALVMMPMLALVLKLVYIRQPFLYWEHLVFSFHVHTFFFLTLALFLLLQNWLGGPIVAIGVFLVSLYPLLAQKRFYGQSWWKTTLKSLIISFLYLIILVMAVLLIGALSVFLF